MQKNKRIVNVTELPTGERISTVFLGVDHNFEDYGPPILFETMIFGGPLDQNMQRYFTWKDAELGHEDMVCQTRRARLKIV